MALAQEEIFGPVLGVIPFSDDAEAVRIANDTRFGLAAGIWTRSLSRAHLLARELRCGNIWVNTYRASAAQAPFGGTKQSGYGRERRLEALTVSAGTGSIELINCSHDQNGGGGMFFAT